MRYICINRRRTKRPFTPTSFGHDRVHCRVFGYVGSVQSGCGSCTMGARARRASLRHDDVDKQISGFGSVASRRTLATNPAQDRMSAPLQVPD